MTATMQLTLIRRYNLGSLFQNISITVDGVSLIPLSELHPASLFNLCSAVPGSVGAKKKRFTPSGPEFGQELLQCFLSAQVRIVSSDVVTLVPQQRTLLCVELVLTVGAKFVHLG